MEFNDVTNKNGILQNCESLCNLGDSGITNNATLKAKFTGWINTALDKVATAILTVDKNWHWDDVASYGNFAVATCNLVSGQRDYVLPRATNSSDIATLWKVYKVRIKNTNGNWFEIAPLASDTDENDDNSSGSPTYYRLLGNSIRLSDSPNSSVTLTAGIQVWFQRAFVKFVVGDTTKQPAFMSSHHHLLQLDASASYLLPSNTALANEYITLFRTGLEELKTSYATRNDDPQTTKRLKPLVEDTR